ncbi:MAG: hypothetical protein KIG65_03595 [Eubacteriales bacterium]|nr:hypothetical protein [Eubacteriales bacterium]
MKKTRLYNVLFPFWMLMLFPQTWIVVLPGNFIIDSVVLMIAMRILKMEDRKLFYKRKIIKIFGIGILSDIAGSAYMVFMMMVLELGRMGDEFYITVPALIISSVCIYILNYVFTFRDCDKGIRIRLAMTFAIATAPYTFLIPSSLLYG